MSNINELLNKATDLNFKDCPKGSACPFKKHACLFKHPDNPLYIWNSDCNNGKDCLGISKICELNHSRQETKATFFVDRRQKPFIPPLLLPPPSYLTESRLDVDDYEPPLHYRSPAPAYIPLRRERSRSRERDYNRRAYDRPTENLFCSGPQEVIIPYVNDKESLCNNGASCRYHKDKICKFMHPDQIEECLQINRTRGVYAAMTRAKQYKNDAKTNCFAKKY